MSRRCEVMLLVMAVHLDAKGDLIVAFSAMVFALSASMPV